MRTTHKNKNKKNQCVCFGNPFYQVSINIKIWANLFTYTVRIVHRHNKCQYRAARLCGISYFTDRKKLLDYKTEIKMRVR